MKTVYSTKSFFYALLLLSLSVLVSCQNDEEVTPETGIVGMWRQTGGELTFNNQNLRDFLQQYFNDQGIPITDEDLDREVAEGQQELDEIFDSEDVFTFQSDGSFELDSSDDSNDATGTYEVRDNQLFFNGNSTPVFTITNLTSSELRLEQVQKQSTSFSDIGLPGTGTLEIGIIYILTKQ